MKHYQAGNTSILAEIIVDYKKKKVDMIDPVERYKITNKKFDFSLGMGGCMIAINIIGFVIIFGLIGFLSDNFVYLILAIMVLGVGLILYMGKVFLIPVSLKFHQIEQYLFHDKFREKKYMVVKDINSKIWKLGYEYDFCNEKLDWWLYGDYKKFIEKVHIKPMDYKVFRGDDRKKAERHDYEWEAVFYFSKIPKEGKMELVWI